MGFLGTLYLGLFVWCIHKTRDKKQIKERIIGLLVVGILNVFLAVILHSIGTTPEDKEGAWVVIPLYLVFFGWRIVLDLISFYKIPQNATTGDEITSPENNAALEEVKKESKFTSQEKNGNYIKEEYLKYINKLYTDGVISEEEYKTEIKKIINNQNHILHL